MFMEVHTMGAEAKPPHTLMGSVFPRTQGRTMASYQMEVKLAGYKIPAERTKRWK